MMTLIIPKCFYMQMILTVWLILVYNYLVVALGIHSSAAPNPYNHWDWEHTLGVELHTRVQRGPCKVAEERCGRNSEKLS